ncbi:MAG: Gfo/Idh/MocA family oxidoreductase [Microcella sp.]|uniref:Gfo/Idh/MocA family protein n=1 Tax=Microcella sp. TaxID=1913979 RepID=UPI0024C5B326|nr:Gfo/Idh/MocA family oxidoreductase [Microcella sp.]UYN82766.1 MAG: Gfo/Idh/MocA family oxidoreductase [Microcella sp.]
MSGPVGVGVIGAGVISNQYLENLVTAADLAVLMVADLDPARAAAQAAAYGVPSSGTVSELLARDDIEIVVNLTIPAAHVPVALDALAAGKHVWSEKPFALDLESGQALLDEAHRVGLRVACAPDTVLGAGVQTGRRLLESGAIGTPLTAFTAFQVSGPEAWHPNPDFLYARGAGPLFDMGPYYLSTLVQLLGPAARVAARGSQARASRIIASGPRQGESFAVEVPTHVSALIDFEGGATAQSTFSFQSSRPRVGVVEIAGTEGTLSLPDPNMFDGELRIWRDGMFDESEAEVVPATGSTFSRGAGVVELARAIRAGRPERASGEFAFHVLDIMVSTQLSAETDGAAVDITSTVPIPPALPETWNPTEQTL